MNLATKLRLPLIVMVSSLVPGSHAAGALQGPGDNHTQAGGLRQIVEAEDGVFSGTVDEHSCWRNVVLSDAQHSTHSGKGAVDTRNEVGSHAEVAFEGTLAGPQTLVVRYVHNKPDRRSAELRVNGAVVNPSLAFPQTGAWTAWKTVSTPVHLEAGRNTIRLTALDAQGLANIDHFEITRVPPVGNSLRPSAGVLPAFNQVPFADPRATKLTDLAYGQAGGETLRLDVSVPAGPGPFPIAILVHGGGWTAGDKSGADKPGSGADITPWFAPVTDAKFTWFSINYRLAPKHRWPAPLDDVLAAIRWVKAHAAEYKGDPSRIALVGHSAGGHLAGLAATVVDDTVRVQAVVGYAPVTTFEQEMLARGELGRAQQGLLNRPKELTPESLGLLRAISPLNHVRPGLPPFLLLHGDADTSVPLRQSLDFQAKLRASGVRCDLIVLPGAPHQLTEWATFMPDHGARMVAWLREILVAPTAASGAVPQIRWDTAIVHQTPEWYGSAEARAVGDSVIQYQSREGGWPKSTDLAVPPRSPEDIPSPGDGRANTIDNDATTLPMEFLALMVHATGDARYRTAFERGVDYLLAAQYPNGGWPQFFPLRGDYYSRITYNDDAMVRVLTLLRDAAAGKPPYAFVDAERRVKAGAAVARGIDVILRTQVKQGGTLRAWCAQHDERTLEPAWARNYEPPTLSGSESVGIVRFLMEIERPTPEIVAAVEGAVAWLRSVAIAGLRLEELTAADGTRDRRVVADPAASPLWARFYALGTNRPVFTGRDKVIRFVFSEIEQERRSGYAYYGTWPARLLATDYPRWRTRQKQP